MVIKNNLFHYPSEIYCKPSAVNYIHHNPIPCQFPNTKFTQGSHFFLYMKLPDFSSISVIFPRLFPHGSKMQIIFIYDFKWG